MKSIDEAIAQELNIAKNRRKNFDECNERKNNYACRLCVETQTCLDCAEEHEQIAKWLEKLKTVENIMLIYNANWYADEDNGVPDCEVLESIWNVIQGNGLDIDIEQDYRKGKADGYNKAIDDFAEKLKQKNKIFDISNRMIDELAEQLKVGGNNDRL